MAQQIINAGAAPNDGTGDPLRTSFTKCNDNFTELYAVRSAPFDALAYNGMQINGSMEVDQPNGGVAVAVAAGTVAHANLMDGWYCAKTGTSAVSVQQVTSVFPGYAKELKLTVPTAQASIGSDTVDLRLPIEGYRISRLAWGTASAIPLTIGFWVKSSLAGTLSLLASNSTLATNATASVIITSANVAQFLTATFPAQTTGTWLTDNGAGIIISIRVAGSGSINIVASAANTFEMTGVVVLPGSEVPSAARSPFIMRSFDQELVICKRYYFKTYSYPIAPGTAMAGGGNTLFLAGAPSGSHCSGHIIYPITMRAAPSVTIYNNAGGAGSASYFTTIWNNGGTVSIQAVGSNGTGFFAATSAIANMYNFDLVADTRL